LAKGKKTYNIAYGKGGWKLKQEVLMSFFRRGWENKYCLNMTRGRRKGFSSKEINRSLRENKYATYFPAPTE